MRYAEQSATAAQRYDARMRRGHRADGEITDPRLTLQPFITGVHGRCEFESVPVQMSFFERSQRL